MNSNLSSVPLIACALHIIYKKLLPNWRSQRLYLCFRLRVLSFKFLHLDLGFILSSFLYVVWGRGPTLFFCMWISCCPVTICWKDYSFPIELDWLLYENPLTIDVLVYFCTLNSVPFICISIMLVPHCFDYYSFAVRFEIKDCESSGFALFQYYFGYSGSLAFPYQV